MGIAEIVPQKTTGAKEAGGQEAAAEASEKNPQAYISSETISLT